VQEIEDFQQLGYDHRVVSSQRMIPVSERRKYKRFNNNNNNKNNNNNNPSRVGR
jgi:hypothetical protein